MVAKWRGVACPTCGALEGAKCHLVGEDESAYTEPHKSRIRLANGEPPPKRRVCDHMVYCPDCSQDRKKLEEMESRCRAQTEEAIIMWLIKDWELNEEARHPGELAERIRSREYLEDLK